MYQVLGNALKRGRNTSHTSPEENKIKNASLKVTDSPTSSSSSSRTSSCASLLSMDEEAVEDAFDAAPSFGAQLAAVLNTRPTLLSGTDIPPAETAKRQNLGVGSILIFPSLLSSSNIAVPALFDMPALPKTRQPMGRPKKPVPENPPPKRPVGRPRIHPKKEIDPNRQKRGIYLRFICQRSAHSLIIVQRLSSERRQTPRKTTDTTSDPA